MLILFGFLLTIPFALNFLASRDDYRRYVDAMFVSGMLGAIWAFTNLMAVPYAFPASKMFHPLVDLIGLSITIAAYMTQRQRWKVMLAFLFLGQLVAHTQFWWSFYHQSGMSGRDYLGLLNVLWFAQLLCVASPGGGHVAVRLGRRMRRFGWHPHLARH